MDNDWQPHMDRFLKLIERRRSQDKQVDGGSICTKNDTIITTSEIDNIVVPTEKDVLFGRGREFQSHQGNLVLERVIERHAMEYSCASTSFSKTCIVAGIVQRVKDDGGRFIRSDKVTKGWSIVDDSEAHVLVGARCRKATKTIP